MVATAETVLVDVVVVFGSFLWLSVVGCVHAIVGRNFVVPIE